MAPSAREDRRPVLGRILGLEIGMWILFGLLLAVYWVHQVLRTNEFRELAENNRQRSVPITAPRGSIVDRNGVPLAENEPSFSLLLYRKETRSLDDSLAVASSLLSRPVEDLRRSVERSRGNYDFLPVVLEDNLGLAEVAAFEARALEHPEFAVQMSQKRTYGIGPAAAHLLGQLGEATSEQVEKASGRIRPGESVGQRGVEAAYQDLLAGISGARTFVIDSFGREVAELDRSEPQPGNTLVLSVDVRLQRMAEDYFRERVGCVVAMDPRNGEILAFFSSPAYDPNLFTRRLSRAEWDGLTGNEDRPLNNRVVQNVYSPGSVWKAFVAYAIVTHGTSPSERVHCPGSATFYGRPFRCHGVHGSVDLATALQVSCDVYFYTMGRRLGIDVLAEAGRVFGFGRPTGIDIAGEKPGLVPSPEWSLSARKQPWYPGETISVAIGQGPVLVSALQIARGFAGIANADGALPTPHLFLVGEDIRTRQRWAYRPRVKEHVPWPEGAREAIVEGLWRVSNVPGGTAYASRVAGLDICGKTGSVQVVGQKDTKKAHLLPEQLRDHGWFAAFAPRESPRLVVAVFVEHGMHGASAAAPLAGKMFDAWLNGNWPAPQPPAPPAEASPTPPAPRPASLAAARAAGAAPRGGG